MMDHPPVTRIPQGISHPGGWRGQRAFAAFHEPAVVPSPIVQAVL